MDRTTVRRPQTTLLPLSDGLRLVHTHDRGARAGIFGIAVKAGSADDRSGEFGLAHFVEHTIFKGTLRRRSWHIINRMEAVGGELNAFTTKEETVVYTVFPAGNTARAVELVSDLAVNSQFPSKEIEKERQVVIDEIYSYRDTPSEAIFDDFEEMILEGTPYAHNILGTPESVEGLGSEDCRSFLKNNYRRENCVLFYSGPMGLDRVAKVCENYFSALPSGDKKNAISVDVQTSVFHREIPLEIHQCHCVTGVSVGGLNSADRYAVALLSNITGGPGMNSLLNVELRERRGLVYSVETSTALFSQAGLLTVYFGCDPEDLETCRKLTDKVFSEIGNGSFDSRRLERARKQYLGQLAIASENRENTIMSAARATLFKGAPTTPEETTEAISSVTVEDLATIAQRMCTSSSLIFTPRNKATHD